MSLVEEVRRIDETRSHWVVKGPAGTRVEWVSVITERIRPEVLAWRSELDSPVPHVGIVRFDEANGGTRVLVRMSSGEFRRRTRPYDCHAAQTRSKTRFGR